MSGRMNTRGGILEVLYDFLYAEGFAIKWLGGAARVLIADCSSKSFKRYDNVLNISMVHGDIEVSMSEWVEHGIGDAHYTVIDRVVICLGEPNALEHLKKAVSEFGCARRAVEDAPENTPEL